LNSFGSIFVTDHQKLPMAVVHNVEANMIVHNVVVEAISVVVVGGDVHRNFDDGVSSLCARGMPPGLADVVATSSQTCATRYWIVDNSGSMQTPVNFLKYKICDAQVYSFAPQS